MRAVAALTGALGGRAPVRVNGRAGSCPVLLQSHAHAYPEDAQGAADASRCGVSAHRSKFRDRCIRKVKMRRGSGEARNTRNTGTRR